MKTLELAKLSSSDIKFDIDDVELRNEANEAIDLQSLLLKEKNIISLSFFYIRNYCKNTKMST